MVPLVSLFLSLLVITATATPLAEQDEPAFSTSEYVSKVVRHRTVAREDFNSPKLSARGQSTLTTDTQLISTNVTFGNQTFLVSLDTGSSDTWLIGTDFQCQDAAGQNIVEKGCGYGATYIPNNSYKTIPDLYLNVTYGDGTFASGVFGNDTLTLAGVQVTNQAIGVANRSYWNGDGFASGLMGLGYPSETSAFRDGKQSTYSSIINTIFFERNLTQPVFSMALARNSEPYGFGGYFALGGLPNLTDPVVNASGKLITVPMQQTNFSSPKLTYEFYVIHTDGFTYGAKSGFGALFFVDSGSPVNYAPPHEAAEINSLFDPPSFPSDIDGQYYVPCNATAPRVGVHIGGQTFYMQPQDLIQNAGFENNTCLSGYQSSSTIEGPQYVLGDVFMRNTLVVFDLGKRQLGFSAREYYASE